MVTSSLPSGYSTILIRRTRFRMIRFLSTAATVKAKTTKRAVVKPPFLMSHNCRICSCNVHHDAPSCVCRRA